MVARAAQSPRGRGSAAGAGRGAAGPRSSPKKAIAGPAVTTPDAEAIALKVLRLGEAGDHQAVLRVLGDPVGPDSSAAVARKAFLRISLLIHPDKLPGLPQATKAFQALVTAFDRSQGAGLPASTAAPKHATIGRSNDGCFRTQVLCPKCKVPWGQAVEGNPDYYYNFMMEGLRTFTCGTCMTTFGCLTGVHICPWCKEAFEYHPDQFHKKVTCGNPGCSKRFGFHMYQASERALKAAREAICVDFEKRMRLEDTRNARARRAARRVGDDEDDLAEAAFAMGLRDTCPRCGLELSEFEDGEQMRHLRSCNDREAHRAHQSRQRSQKAASEAARKKEEAQLSAASSAVWSFSGGHASQLWMLDTEQLKKHCSQAGLATSGSREALVARLAEHLVAKKGGKNKNIPVCLPENFQSLSDSQLAVVCAAHRLPGLTSREERLEALEELQIDGGEGLHANRAIEGGPKARAIADRGVKRRPSAAAESQVLALEDRKEVATKASAKSQAKAKAKPKAQGKATAKAAKGKKAAFWGKARRADKK